MNRYSTTRIGNGEMANRILKALYDNLPAKTLLNLRSTKLFYSDEGMYLDWFNLCYEHFDDYSKLTSVPLRWLVLGKEELPFPDYTDYDEQVVPYIRALSSAECIWVEDMIIRYHPAIIWEKEQITNPTERFNAYLASRRPEYNKRERAEAFLRPEYATPEICQEILRVRRMASDANFRTDFLPELAVAAGVSIHWILMLDGELYFHTPEQERVYDLFTLIPDFKQKLIAEILRQNALKGEKQT